MSDSTSNSSPEVELHHHNNPATDLIWDIIMWRRKTLNVLILAGATATWILMDIYQYNFITLLSWAAMAVCACLFFWGSLHRLLKKEAPDLSELEISEETAVKTAKSVHRCAEDGVRLMFHISVEREWYVFLGVVVGLLVISEVARHLDFPTICYLGVVGVMTVPITYVKNEEKIRKVGNDLKKKAEGVYWMGVEKWQKAKNKIAGKQGEEIKEKKME